MYLGHNMRPYMTYLPAEWSIPLTRSQNNSGLNIEFSPAEKRYDRELHMYADNYSPF